MDADNFTVRRMKRAEMDLAVDWAAAEGWNPGLHDAKIFYSWDGKGFFTAASGGEPLGFISAVAYGENYGFVGFFVVKPELRGHRIGVELGRAALARLDGRNIGIDGVLNKVKNYQAFGFKMAHKNSRYMGENRRPQASADVTDIKQAPLSAVLEYDAECFGQPRVKFVKSWIAQPASFGATVLAGGGKLGGYAMARKCRDGYKIGPLFADDETLAARLLDALLARLPEGEKYFLDVPETNAAAVALAQKRGLVQVFSTARMYNRYPPDLPASKIFGITSFELG